MSTTTSDGDLMPTDGEALISIIGVKLKLGDNQVLDGVDLVVRDRVRSGQVTGQVVSLLGPSGVGKTRLLRIIAGLDAPDAGAVLGPKGVPLHAGSVGVVFQDYPLLRHRTALGNLIIAGQAGGLHADAAHKRAQHLLKRFGLDGRQRHYPAQLSGGQRQRVAIAQQLMVPRALLLMDEPFSGLDPVASTEVMALISEVAHMDEFNTIMLVTHDLRAAMAVSDTLFVLGRERDAQTQPRSGARVRATYDLVARGLAWHSDVEDLPAFTALARDLRALFPRL